MAKLLTVLISVEENDENNLIERIEALDHVLDVEVISESEVANG